MQAAVLDSAIPCKGRAQAEGMLANSGENSAENSLYTDIYADIYAGICSAMSGNICADLGIYPSLMFHIARRPVAFTTGAEAEAHLKMPIKKFNLIPKTEAEPVPPLCCSPSSPLRLPSQYFPIPGGKQNRNAFVSVFCI